MRPRRPRSRPNDLYSVALHLLNLPLLEVGISMWFDCHSKAPGTSGIQ